MKKIDIKGKEYVPVNERVIAFRKDHPEWTLATEVESLDKGFVLMKTTIRDEEGRVISSAYAYEREDASFINKTSFIENCETSAVGRALGFLGIGVDTSIATFEEVANAITNQEQMQKKASVRMSDGNQYAQINNAIAEGILNGATVKKMIQKKGKQTFKSLTYEEAQDIVTMVLALRKQEEKNG